MFDGPDSSQPVALGEAPSQNLVTEEELKTRADTVRNGLRGLFFPVLGIEAPRVILMAVTFSLITFVYTFLRLYKDTVILDILEPSAQDYLKIFTFIASFLFVGVLNKLSSRFEVSTVFEMGTVAFSIIFILLSVLIKLDATYWIFDELWAKRIFVMGSASCRKMEPFYILALILNQWLMSLFYVLSEVVGSIMVGYMFMLYVNSICTADQNRRFVRFLFVFSNASALLATLSISWWSSWSRRSSYQSVKNCYFIFTISAAGIFLVVWGLKKWIDVVFKRNPLVIASGKTKKAKSKKSVGLADGLYYASISKLLMSMCLITLFYNILSAISSSLNNTANKAAETILKKGEKWTMKMKAREGIFSSVLTIVALVSPLSKLFDAFGPISTGTVPILAALVGMLGCVVLGLINYQSTGEENMPMFRFFNVFETCPMVEAIWNLGTVSALKITKYAFFDIMKEAISMKISPEIRPIFKGVYDGLCGKMGKSLGSGYGILMSFITGVRDARYYVPVTGLVVITFCLLWFYAIWYLHRSYKKATEANAFMSPDYAEGFNPKEE